MKLWRYILVAISLSCGISAMGDAPKWEQLSVYASDDAVSADTDKIEVSVKDGYIYISTNRPVTVKVMSILGQMVSQQNVSAGVSRIRISARGIYILKAGTFTTRVTV